MQNVKSKLHNPDIYEEIKKAVLRKFIKHDGKEDIQHGLNVFNLYFNKSGPILDINAPIPGHGDWCPLFITSWLGHKQETKALLSLNADSNVKVGKEEIQPIHIASANGHTILVQYFLSLNVDVNTKTKSGKTPLMLAAEGGHLKTVELLIKNRADIELLDLQKQTAIDYSKKHKNTEIEALLQFSFLNSTIKYKKEANPRLSKI